MANMESFTLIDLILNENNKVPNIEGNTPLVLRAIENSKLDLLSREKEKFEEEVCDIVKNFSQFNQTNFAELESYILVSKFNVQKILISFSNFIKNETPDEDIVLKAFVLRFIQNFNSSLFQLDYVKKRFFFLKENDPWVYAEIVSKSNWDEGIIQITDILKHNNDSSYLFVLLVNWMSEKQNEDNLKQAISIWEPYLNNEDRKLIIEFCKQYSIDLKTSKTISNDSDSFKNAILNSSGLMKFNSTKKNNKFESIPT